MALERFDKIIIGAGLYGLYSALFCCKRGQHVLVLECDPAPFQRATTINQARVHQGYHYPRSLSTALKSAGYFERFCRDYHFCVNQSFEQIYATSAAYSWTDGKQFKAFCDAAGIPCMELHPGRYFKPGMCDGAFLTREYTYDAAILRDHLLEELSLYRDSLRILYNTTIREIQALQDGFVLSFEEACPGSAGRRSASAPFVLNAAYAGVNQVLRLAGFPPFPIKYELCEIILCETGDALRSTGITVMDGPFFSIMPYGKTGLHSLTSVTRTPHEDCHEALPAFSCQDRSGGKCSTESLYNCSLCPAKPESAYPYMSHLARKYMRDEYDFRYKESLYSMKPILTSSEIDDSRPTVIRRNGPGGAFVSVLSGKINTVYDLDEVLE